MNFAGNIDVREAWALQKSDAKAQLFDVRTTAEWSFVGVPDLSSLGRAAIQVEWQSFPGMARNPGFEQAVRQKLEAAGASDGTPIMFICRSGARSQAAAIAMTAAGFKTCFNVASGFEGDLDGAKHRGQTAGWKFAKLPWVQA